jgi:hypothetical protein
LHFVVHDFKPRYDTYTEKPGYSWNADVAYADANPADCVALVIRAVGRPNISAAPQTASGSSGISLSKRRQ